MLCKLLKYEFSAIAKELLPLYLLMIVATLVTTSLLTAGYDTATGFSFIALGALSIAAIVMTLVMVCQRFSKNLLKDEGYLMFTLPVSGTELLCSKLLASGLWILIGAVVGLVCAFITFFGGSVFEFSEISDILAFIAKYNTAADSLAVIEVFIWALICIALFLLTVYLSLSISQLPVFYGRETLRKVAPVFTFILLYAGHNIVFSALYNIVGYNPFVSPLTQASFLPVIGLELLFAAILFFLVNFILSKHLNLE